MGASRKSDLLENQSDGPLQKAKKIAPFHSVHFCPHIVSLFSSKSWPLQVVASTWSLRVVVLRHFNLTLPIGFKGL